MATKKQTILTETDKQLLLSKSVKALPDNPSDKGFSADQIKKKMYDGLVTLFAWLKRAIEENNQNVDLTSADIASINTALATINSYFTNGKAKKAIGDEDGNNIKASYCSDLNIPETVKTASSVKIRIQVINKNGTAIGTLKQITIPTATAEYAGLLSAETKTFIDNIPNEFISEDDIVDSVDSSDTTKPLSANQGRVLKQAVNSSAHSLEIDDDTFEVSLLDAEGNVLSTIDLPLESVVVSGRYDPTTKKVILVLKDGSEIEFSVADLVSGLLSEGDLIISGGAIVSIVKGGTVYPIAQNVTVGTTPVITNTVADLPEENDGLLHLVLSDGYVYYYQNGWQQGVQYTTNIFTVTDVTVEED